MDGKGCLPDNVFVERLWRSVKYEEVDLQLGPQRLEPGSAATSTSTTASGRPRALAAARPKRYTSTAASRSGMINREQSTYYAPRDCSDKLGQLSFLYCRNCPTMKLSLVPTVPIPWQ